MTIEELQEQLLEIKEQVKTIEQERDTYKQETETHVKRISELQEHNQKLFLRLTTDPELEEQEEVIDLTEYAKTIKF